MLDHTIRFQPVNLASKDDIDFRSIDPDIYQSVKYARGSKYALRAPALKEEVGAFVSDDLVPGSLHREVCLTRFLVVEKSQTSMQLVAELDGLSEKEPKDFHPGTYGKVKSCLYLYRALG